MLVKLIESRVLREIEKDFEVSRVIVVDSITYRIVNKDSEAKKEIEKQSEVVCDGV